MNEPRLTMTSYKPFWIAGWSEPLLRRLLDGMRVDAGTHADVLASIKGKLAAFTDAGSQLPLTESVERATDLDAAFRFHLDELQAAADGAYVPCLVDVDFPRYVEALPDSVEGRALLLWESPLAALRGAEALSAVEQGDDFEAVLESWRQYHEKLLTVFRSRPDKTLLLRVDRLDAASGEPLRDAVGRICVDPLPPGLFDSLLAYAAEATSRLPASKYVDEDTLLALLADAYPACHDLYLDLESCGALLGREAELGIRYPDPRSLSKTVLALRFALRHSLGDASEAAAEPVSEPEVPDPVDVAQPAEDLSSRIDELNALVNALREERDGLKAELDAGAGKLKQAGEESELLLLQLHQVQEELEQVFLGKTQSDKERDESRVKLESLAKEFDKQSQLVQESQKQISEQTATLAALTGERDALKSDLDSTTRQLKEATEESELLLLQLHQVQEELEHYFLEHQQALQLLDRFKTSQAQTRALVARLAGHFGGEIVQPYLSK